MHFEDQASPASSASTHVHGLGVFWSLRCCWRDPNSVQFRVDLYSTGKRLEIRAFLAELRGGRRELV
jgi:hypothetical protein